MGIGCISRLIEKEMIKLFTLFVDAFQYTIYGIYNLYTFNIKIIKSINPLNVTKTE